MTHTSTEQERAEFEARFNHLDLTQEPDAWGVPRYKHGAISLAWEAWQAARRAPAVQEGWCDGCSPDNCVGCGPAAPAQMQPKQGNSHE